MIYEKFETTFEQPWLPWHSKFSKDPISKPCEKQWFSHLAKPYKTLWNCKLLTVQNTEKPYLRKCVKACENSNLQQSFCETVLKVHLLLAPFPSLCSSRACSSNCLLSLVILNIFRVFVIIIPKPIVNAVFLSFVCPKCFTFQVCQPTYDEIQC